MTIKTKCGFQQHMGKHSGIFPYNCPYCNKGINNTQRLKGHLKKHHTGLLGYHCIKCMIEFDNIHQLNNHLSDNSCTGKTMTIL